MNFLLNVIALVGLIFQKKQKIPAPCVHNEIIS